MKNRCRVWLGILCLSAGGCRRSDAGTETPAPTSATPSPEAQCESRPTGEARRLVIGNSRIHDVRSDLTGKDYEIIVGLPGSYASSPERRYPVLYLLDGQWDFNLLNTLQGGLVYDEMIEEFVIVGLSYGGADPNYDRLRAHDYTPTHSPSEIEYSGGGPDFLKFIETVVFPLVEGEYRVDPRFRMLSGSSMGGLFTMYAMFERPELFRAYLALSPNVPWDDGYLLRREKEFAASHPELGGKRLWLSVGEREWADYTKANVAFFDQVEASAYPGLALSIRVVDGEHHAGVKPEAYNRAIRFAFAADVVEPQP